MPNWCYNRLQIRGTRADMLAFINDGMRTASTTITSFDAMPKDEYKELTEITQLNSDKFLFPHLSAWLPMPKELITNDSIGWRNWAIGNWGCKWDVEIDNTYNEFTIYDDEETDETLIVLDYETAWSPNDEWVRNVGEKYPNLYFELDAYEPGCQIEFGCTCCDGNYCECEPDQCWIEDWKFGDEEEDEEWDDSSLPQH